jgi:hypothetical protein
VEKWRPIKAILAAPLWEEVLRESKSGEFLFAKGLKTRGGAGCGRIRSENAGTGT